MPIDMFQIGLGALNAAQTHLTTTSHNIANANTDGYSRQRVDQQTTQSQFFGGVYQGTGTQITDINRVYDQYAFSEVITSQSQHQYAATRAEQLGQMDQLLSKGSEFISSSLDEFYKAASSVTDSPADEGLRTMLLSKGTRVDAALSSVYNSLEIQRESLNKEIDATANRINELSAQIASTNEQIMVAKAAGGGEPNDLLDTRDQMLKELAEYTNIKTVADPSGGVSVFMGNTQMLVASTQSFKLSVVQGNPDSENVDLELQIGGSSKGLDGVNIGGALGALIDTRDGEMKTAQAEMDILAMAFSDTINSLQSEGLDLDGLRGKAIFNDINDSDAQLSRVLYHAENTGSLVGRVNITDTAKLTAQDYQIVYDGTNYVLQDPKGQRADQNLGAPGSGPYAIADLGIEFIEQSGTPAAGDTFTLKSFNQAIDRFEVVMTNPKGIAASSAVTVQPSDNNVSNGSVKITKMDDPQAARALMPYTVQVLENPANNFTYNVLDGTGASVVGGAQTYTPPSQEIDLGDFSIEIVGHPSGQAPNAPETFNIVDGFGSGNSLNMQSINLTKDKKLLFGGTETLQGAYANTTSKVGASASDAILSESVALDILGEAETRVSSTGGVSLDEEAANLLKYQQAYQAASRIVSVARDIFDVLFQAT